jgi:hypothetical protein
MTQESVPVPITLAKATALILIAHHEQHLPFFTGIRWGGTEQDILSIDFASGAALRAWLGFFGAVEASPLLTTDGTAWLIDAATYISNRGGWRGVDLTLHAKELIEPAVDGELGELVDQVQAVTDAAEIVAETVDVAGAAGRTSTMDMLAAAPRARAHLLREGIASLDEPAPYLPVSVDDMDRTLAGRARRDLVEALRLGGPSELLTHGEGIASALADGVIVAYEVEHLDGQFRVHYELTERCPATWYDGPCPGVVIGADGRCASHTRDGVAGECSAEVSAHMPAAAPTGDEANRETAAVLRARHQPVRFGDITEMPDPAAAGDGVEVDNDAAVSRLIGAGR